MRTIWLCLAAGALITTACGSGGDDGDDAAVSSDPGVVTTEADDGARPPDDATTTPPEGSEPPGTTGADDSTPDEGDPVPGGSLTYGTFADSVGFGLLNNGTGYSNPAIYDSLMRFDEGGDPVPHVAESMETEDNVTWTLKLREGVNFHDGTPLNADAVIFSIERHMNPDNLSPRLVYTEPIESMSAIDDMTVEFVLKEPFKPFAASFANTSGLGMIPSPTAVEQWGEEYNLHPVGVVGPFVFESWVQDDRLVLKRNEDYWQEGLPYLDELIYRPVPDTQSREQAIANGDVDLAYFITAQPILALREQPGVEVLSAAANGGEGIMLNPNRPPFDDPRMREAFVQVMDPQAIANVRYGGDLEMAESAIGLIAPTDATYNAEVEEAWPGYDPENAKQLIAEYKAEGNDPSMTMMLPNGPDRREFGAMASQFFRDADWDVEFAYLDISEYVTSVLRGNDFQSAIMSRTPFVAKYPTMWDAYHTDGSANFSKFSNPDVDAALETAITSADKDEVFDAWQEVQLLLVEEIPYATFGRPPTAIVAREHVHGVDKESSGTLWPATLWTD